MGGDRRWLSSRPAPPGSRPPPYGKRGLTQLAAAAGVSQQLLSFIVLGERTVSDEVYRKVADALFAESERLISASETIGLMAGKMLSELED